MVLTPFGARHARYGILVTGHDPHFMVAAAGGSLSEKELAAWLRENGAKPRRTKKEG